jgi:hypothetical protein
MYSAACHFHFDLVPMIISAGTLPLAALQNATGYPPTIRLPSGLSEISYVQLVLILFCFSNCQSPSFKGLSCHSSTNPGLGFFYPSLELLTDTRFLSRAVLCACAACSAFGMELTSRTRTRTGRQLGLGTYLGAAATPCRTYPKPNQVEAEAGTVFPSVALSRCRSGKPHPISCS